MFPIRCGEKTLRESVHIATHKPKTLRNSASFYLLKKSKKRRPARGRLFAVLITYASSKQRSTYGKRQRPYASSSRQLTTTRNHLQQTTAGVVILSVFLEVGRQFVNTSRQQSDLHFRRTRVTGLALELSNDFGLFDILNRLSFNL